MARPPRYNTDLKHQLVVSAARELRFGSAKKISVRALAAGAGTTTNAIYSMFHSKAGLLQAAMDLELEDFNRHLAHALGESRPYTTADLRRVAHVFRDWAHDHPGTYREFGRQYRDNRPLEPIHSWVVYRVAADLAERMPVAEDMAFRLLAGLDGWVTLEMASGRRPDEQFELFLDGLIGGLTPDGA